MTAEERAARASRIRELIEHPDVKDAIASIESDLIAEWRQARDTQERENCWHGLKGFERLLTYLNSYASSDLTALRRAK